MRVVISCEHASNRVPPQFRELFSADGEILESHRGYDIGAKQVATLLSRSLKANLLMGEISRLLIDLNSSPGNRRKLFSHYSRNLPDKQREQLVDRFYRPYHEKIFELIESEISAGSRVLHLSVHSFTPVYRGIVRKTEIGLLYDPQRRPEKEFCDRLKLELRHRSKLIVHCNAPYRGVSDGVTTILRRRFPEKHYLGIELELNQKFFTSERDKSGQPGKALLSALRAVIA